MSRLKELRIKRELTQQQLVDELNETFPHNEKPFSKMNISNWENGKHNIKPEKAQQLADYFGVSVGYLLGYDTVGGILELSALVQSGKLSIDEIEDKEIQESIRKHIATIQKTVDEEAQDRSEETYLRFITDLEKLKTLKSDMLVAIRFIENIQNNLRHDIVKPYSYAQEMDKIIFQLLDLLDRIEQRENELRD
ncbi:helix-turn-helix domain-containing protein [Streptococcus sp. SN3]|uniref:helix-turn-helix domain-containing protein n=1 Tax=Streptococcus sp. SN3 TaxID=3018246 RepID=UPI00263D1D07|nr:helix-turn-helix domain-containing protein [Streptococcus sp. SN3]MDN5012750.1 helix-turn-helix domain-containing protein [Streptococcus sp. SN3]